MIDASTWPKLKQYYYYLNSLWGKMVATVNCGTGEFRDLRGVCPNQAKLTGVVCPRFDEADIARITPIYMKLYPEHRGFEERLAWIIRCTFGPGCVAMPSEASRLAPYVQQRRRPVYVEPAIPPVIPRPDIPAAPPPDIPAAPPGVTVSPPTEREGIPSWVKIAAILLLACLILRE